MREQVEVFLGADEGFPGDVDRAAVERRPVQRCRQVAPGRPQHGGDRRSDHGVWRLAEEFGAIGAGVQYEVRLIVHCEHGAVRLDRLRVLHKFAVATRKLDVPCGDDVVGLGWIHGNPLAPSARAASLVPAVGVACTQAGLVYREQADGI